MKISTLAAVGATLWLTAFVIPVAGGELKPPGPPGSTMKPLSDVEARTAIRNDPTSTTPIVINKRGSYYLAEDIFALPDNHGIEIIVSHVTLDLNGYSVIGSTELNTLTGIYTDSGAALSNIVIRNGAVRDFSGNGISLPSVDYAVVERLRVLHNGWDGTGSGIDMGPHGHITDTHVVDNGDTGIDAGNFNVIARVTVSGNGGSGVGCAVGSAGCKVIDSVAVGNGSSGIAVWFGVVEGCTASGNSVDDITVASSLVRGNRAGSIDDFGATSLLIDNLDVP